MTDAHLRKLRQTGVRYEVSDAGCTGLRVRVSVDGAIRFILKARGDVGAPKTVTPGSYPAMSLKAAREAAARTRLDLKAGKNPNKEKQEKRDAAVAATSAPTLAQLLLEYEQAFGGSKSIWSMRGPKSAKSGARACIQLVFAHLLEKKVEEVTDAQFSKEMTAY